MTGPDARASHWLATHHGVITRHRAVSLGLSTNQVDHLVRTGAWEVLHRAV